MNHRGQIAKSYVKAVKVIFLVAVSLSILMAIFMSQASAVTGPNITSLSSPTHPDPNKWYASNDPVFDWDSFDLSMLGTYDTPGFAQAVAVQGNYAYVADTGSGLQIIDVSDPAVNPLPLAGSLDTTGSATGVAVRDPYAYVGDGTAGLKIINVSNPSSPSLTGTAAVGGIAREVAVADQYAYVAAGAAGLKIVKIADPAHPVLVGTYDSPGLAYGVAVVGQYAYLMDGTAGVNVVDVSRAEEPVSVATVDTPDSARQIKIVGNRGYVADALSGLQILDVSDVLNPTIIGSYRPGSDCRSVAVSGNYAFIVDQSNGVFALDITDPAHVTVKNSYNTPDAAFGIAIGNGHAFVADYQAGLEAFSIHSPEYSYLIDTAQTTEPDSTSEGSNVSTQINDVPDGEQYFHVRAGDGMGNWGAPAHHKIKVDAAAPDVYGLNVTDPAGTDSAVVTAYYGDAMSGIDTASASVTVSGGLVSGCTVDGRIQCNVTGLAFGDHDVNVSVADNAGNVGTASGSFNGGVPDVVAPTVANILPTGTVTGDSAVVSAYFNDPVPSSGIDTSSASMVVYGGTVSNCSVTGSGMSCTASGLVPGEHGIEVSVSDNAGNTGSGSGSFTSKSAEIAYRWTWYDSINLQDWVLIANPSGAAQNLEFDLTIGKASMGLGNLGFGPGVVPQGETLTPSYTGLMDGPVTAISKNGAKAIVSQRSLLGDSFEEVLGTEKQSSHFYWTWYDMKNAGFQNWILVANPSTEPVRAEIIIAGETMTDASGNQYFDIAPESNVIPTFPGEMGGPVEVKAHSVNGSWDNPDDRRDVIASQRVLSNSGTAFNEMPGIPEDELSDNYLWTWYDQKSPGFQDWVLIANPNDTEVSFEIEIASSAQYGAGASEYGIVPAHEIVYRQFPGVMSGPVKVTASDNVIASQRVIAGPSFGEVPGYPESSLTDDYHWTWYDMQNPGSINWVLVANPGTEPVRAEIVIAGNVMTDSATGNQYFDIAPGSNAVPTFPGTMDGPVEVKAHRVGGTWDTVADRRDVMVSQRVLWKGYFNEVLGTVLN